MYIRVISLIIILFLVIHTSAQAQTNNHFEMPAYFNASDGCAVVSYTNTDYADLARFSDWQVVIVSPSRQNVIVQLNDSGVTHTGQMCFGAGDELGLWSVSHVSVFDSQQATSLAFSGPAFDWPAYPNLRLIYAMSGQMTMQVGLTSPTVTPVPEPTATPEPDRAGGQAVKMQAVIYCSLQTIRLPFITLTYLPSGCVKYLGR